MEKTVEDFYKYLLKIGACYPKNRPPQFLSRIRDISNGNSSFPVPDFQPTTEISADFMTDFP